MSGFRRLVLELGHGAADPATMREAAAFAHLLDAELHALFVEDETLLRASGLPFTREISPLSYQWRSLDPDRLEAELRVAAEQARRHLIEAANAIGVRRGFEVLRGDLASHVIQTCVASDIVVVASAPKQATHGSGLLRETADRSAASVLFLPPKTSRRRGPVVAVATGDDDPGLAVARWIAEQGHERLLILTEDSGGDMAARVIAGRALHDVVAALGDTRERLIVVTREGAEDDLGAELAAARGVPVLVLEPVKPVTAAP